MSEYTKNLINKLFDQNKPLTDDAASLISNQEEEIEELKDCLKMAHDDTMDYLKLNNLGGENNHWLVWARRLLDIKHPTKQNLTKEEIENFEWLIIKAFDFPPSQKVLGLDRIIKMIESRVKEKNE